MARKTYGATRKSHDYSALDVGSDDKMFGLAQRIFNISLVGLVIAIPTAGFVHSCKKSDKSPDQSWKDRVEEPQKDEITQQGAVR